MRDLIYSFSLVSQPFTVLQKRANMCLIGVCLHSQQQLKKSLCVLTYTKRLKMLNLNSLHRRRERYCIIYLWKILEGLVPNFSDPIVCSFSDRRGRSCTVSHVNPGRQGTLAFNSFRWRSVRIFNRLPIHIRNISACSIDRFKSQLDRYLIGRTIT